MLGIESLAYRANGSGKTTLARIVMGCAGYAPSARASESRSGGAEPIVDQSQLETLMAHGLAPEEAIDLIVTGILQ